MITKYEARGDGAEYAVASYTMVPAGPRAFFRRTVTATTVMLSPTDGIVPVSASATQPQRLGIGKERSIRYQAAPDPDLPRFPTTANIIDDEVTELLLGQEPVPRGRSIALLQGAGAIALATTARR